MHDLIDNDQPAAKRSRGNSESSAEFSPFNSDVDDAPNNDCRLETYNSAIEDLKNIMAKAEEGTERRHQDKMKFQDNLLNIFEKMLDILAKK